MGSGRGSGLDFGRTRGSKNESKRRERHPKALRYSSRAKVTKEKLDSYVLDFEHPKGKDKARVFKSALGFTKENSKELAEKIMKELPYHEAVKKGSNKYGDLYQVDMPIVGANGVTKTVRTGWIIEHGKEYPRLTSARVWKRG